MSNKLKFETSPYLLQHAENPVEWYPWGKEAFAKARAEDKPVFLSIGYSTCHWCHVMAHESFEDEEVAALLNRHFISVKVDREERPDIDSIYMSVCQAFTGSGGWPTSIFMTPDQKPFFAGTYFPKTARGGMIGMTELLTIIADKWNTERSTLLGQADKIVAVLNKRTASDANANADLADSAAELNKNTYDRKNGGFGAAPKFPAPHNLIFLLEYYERNGDEACLEMAERTLLQMYRGGLFDHIGFGFCRYSTDKRFLVPHFEKMLYDNALLILAYCKAYEVTKKPLYLAVAEKTAAYLTREMTLPDGGFYSAQDADSDGEEGKYYLLNPEEIVALLGERDANAFCRHFGIAEGGNFEGRSIPNLLESDPEDTSLDILLPKIYDYRKTRCSLHLDDKVLTSWNSLAIAAMCALYRVSGNKASLTAAENADRFIRKNLCDGDTLFVSYRAGKRGVKGFLDDYASYIFAQLALYGATLDREYLSRAERLTKKVISDFGDITDGGFFMCGSENEKMILSPKESYDGAIPSGNSLMAHNLVRLSQLASDESFADEAKRRLDFLSAEAAHYPAGYAMFLSALQNHFDPPPKVTVVLADPADIDDLPLALSSDTVVTVLPEPNEEFPLKNGKTTYYVCRDHRCLPPVTDPTELTSAAVPT